MKHFFASDDFNRPGGEAESKVWEKVKESFSEREVIAYSRYPLFAKVGEKRKEPDILILDKQEGLIIIEVKGFHIADIESVGPNEWVVCNQYERIIDPFHQVEDYLYTIKGRFEAERELRNKFKGRALVAVPYITKSEWCKRFSSDVIPNMIFADDLSKGKLLNKLVGSTPLLQGRTLADDEYSIALSLLGYEKKHTQDNNYILPKGKKAQIYAKVQRELYRMDFQQEEIARNIPPGPQRIRGIAGSGKTLLICQKAAYMHLRYPEWKIAVVFSTQSLYEVITETINNYIKYFLKDTEMETYKSNGNLQILHAWGSKQNNGLFKTIAEANGCRNVSVNEVERRLNQKYVPQNIALNFMAKDLLEKKDENLKQIYDAILIDEGQDLVADDQYKYKDKQAYYYMVYQSLKPVDGDVSKRRLIWAYDELQSLQTQKIPTGKEIFGDSSLMTGTYKGGIKKSYIMKKCYRTPKDILTTAHAIGMGFFRTSGILSGYTTKEDWKNIGYEVEQGSFKKNGSKMVIKRDDKYSPNPISKFNEIPRIVFNTYKNNSDLFEDLASDIENDINKQGLNPTKDILVVCLRDSYDKEYIPNLTKALRKRGVNYYIPSFEKINVCVKNSDKTIPQDFWRDTAVTISRIERAKGNEAAMVYVVGLEQIAEKENDLNYRNKLFVALTRAKCWVKIMGTGAYSLYDELRKCIESNGRFEFIYNKPRREANDDEL